jgi:hypothetical protein
VSVTERLQRQELCVPAKVFVQGIYAPLTPQLTGKARDMPRPIYAELTGTQPGCHTLAITYNHPGSPKDD